jgi:hypothetical protein
VDHVQQDLDSKKLEICERFCVVVGAVDHALQDLDTKKLEILDLDTKKLEICERFGVVGAVDLDTKNGRFVVWSEQWTMFSRSWTAKNERFVSVLAAWLESLEQWATCV